MRGHGEGSITQRKDGIWQAAISLEGGKRRFYYGPTRKAVSDKLKEALRDQLRGILPTGPDQTVESYLTRWLADVAKHTVRPSTFEDYEEMVRVHALPAIGKLKLSKLTAQQLQALYSAMLAKGLSPSTAQKMHAILHRALDQAMRWDIVARNVADLVDAPRPGKREMQPLDSEQAARFLEVARGDRLHALYVVAVSTGMRQSEMLGLTWQDVDFDAATLHVRQQLGRITGEGFKFSEPKTSKGRRSISLPAFAVVALREHRVRQLEERLKASSEWVDQGLVFANEVGRPIERQNLVRRSFQPLLEKAGCPRIRFHDLRHTAATLLLSQGVHPKVAQERLGHSTIGMTLDVYSHVLPDMQRDAADKLEALFGVG